MKIDMDSCINMIFVINFYVLNNYSFGVLSPRIS